MGYTSSKVKKRYNKSVYRRYEFNIRMGTKLDAIIERYKKYPDNSLSELIKSCLCQHFGISREEADDIFVEYRMLGEGLQEKNNELDKYFPGEFSHAEGN